jgi:hypothetical protein
MQNKAMWKKVAEFKDLIVWEAKASYIFQHNEQVVDVGTLSGVYCENGEPVRIKTQDFYRLLLVDITAEYAGYLAMYFGDLK